MRSADRIHLPISHRAEHPQEPARKCQPQARRIGLRHGECRFETEKSFQYPTFREHDGASWLTVTQGDSDAARKERIMFGKLA